MNVVCVAVSPSAANSRDASSSRSMLAVEGRSGRAGEARAGRGRARPPAPATSRAARADRRAPSPPGSQARRRGRRRSPPSRAPPCARAATADGSRRRGSRSPGPRHLGHALHRLGPLDPEPARQLVPQVRLVEVAGREPVGAQDRLAVERAPPAVRGAGQVRDDHVRVKMRVLRPARAVAERGRDEALTVLADRAAATAAHDARLALEIGDRRLPGRLVRLAHLAPHPLVVGERVQEADALRAREDQVVARDRREPLLLLLPLAAPASSRAP